jgi:uncharacterized protein (TIGR02678 family)
MRTRVAGRGGVVRDLGAEPAAERRAAARLLLRKPLVTAADAEFPLVRRHAEHLRRRFAQVLGYRLTVEHDFARLHKAGLGPRGGHRLERAAGTPFTPRTYAYLALALSVLVTAPAQLLLSELVTQTRAAAAEAGIALGEAGRAAERRALVAALKQLAAWGALKEDEGTVESYAGDDSAEALLTVDREIARHLVSGPVGAAATPEELIERAADPGRGGPRHAVRRLLVETPVVYAGDLDEERLDWLRRHQRREQRVLEEFLGADLEIRAEGVAMVDPRGELTDVEFPGTGTVAQAALLLIERLVAEGPGAVTAAQGPRVPDATIQAVLAELTDRHRRHWANRAVDSPIAFRDEVVDLLERFRLLEDGVLMPAAARYAFSREERPH